MMWFRLLMLGWLISGFALAQLPYQNPNLSVSERVTDLLNRMTLEEKIGQMTQINVTRLMGNGEWDAGPLNPIWLERAFEEHHVGSVLSGGGAAPVPNTPRNWAVLSNELQDYNRNFSRLGIPLLYGIDAVHGHNNVLGATIYPHNIGLAASWNPELVRMVAERVAEDMLAVGTPWTFAPVADVGRDPRWGRFYETFGEDPLLVANLTFASVEGFETSGRVSATVKHFIGYGQPLVGFDRSPAFLDMRSLRSIHLPAFEAGIAAGAGAVMANSGSLNSIPVHASGELLTDLLRSELVFTGVLVSDWEDILKLVTVHKVAANFADAVAMSIGAGIDMYMVPHDIETFTTTLLDLVTAGEVSEDRINEAVSRILSLKFRLGLFEESSVDADAAAAIIIETERSLAKQAALESITLLERGELPLQSGNLLVVGPSADNLANQMGGWTIGWQGMPDPNQTPPGLSILEALEQTAPETLEVHYLENYRNQDALTAAIAESDYLLLILGEPPYAEQEGDSATLGLSTDQLELLRIASFSGVPTGLILVAGRPLIIPEDIWLRLDSFIMAYLPGSEGGSAVADIVYGRANPSGRLPFSWPKHAGQLPLTYDVYPGSPYDPLYSFGYGLGYSNFSYANLSAALHQDEIVVSINLANLGRVAGADVAQLYLSRPPVGVLSPERQLIAFERVWLEPGESRSIELSIPLQRLAVIPGDISGTSEKILSGSYTLHLGNQSVRVSLP